MSFNSYSQSYPTSLYYNGTVVGFICNKTYWAAVPSNAYNLISSNLVLNDFTDIYYHNSALRTLLFSGITNTFISLLYPPSTANWYIGPNPLSGYSARKMRLSNDWYFTSFIDISNNVYTSEKFNTS
jgi:hypothetical protein